MLYNLLIIINIINIKSSPHFKNIIKSLDLDLIYDINL